MTDHFSSLLVCKAWFFCSSNSSHALLWRLSFFFFQCSTTANIVQQENLICNSPLDCLLISHGFNPPLDSLWFLMFTLVFTMYVYATESKPSAREFRNAAEGRWVSMEIVKARKIWGNGKRQIYSEKRREEKGTGSLLETRTLRGAARLENEHPKWRWLMKSPIAALGRPAFLPYLSVSLFLVLLSPRAFFSPNFVM